MVLPRIDRFPPLESELNPDFSAPGSDESLAADLFSLARHQQSQGRLAEALDTYARIQTDSAVLQERVAASQAAIAGTGGLSGVRVEFLADRFVDTVMDPASLAAMVGAGATYRLSRAGFLRVLAPLAGESGVARTGASLLSSGMAFSAEATTFPLWHNGAEMALGHSVDGSADALASQIQSSFLVLGGLRAFGVLGRNAATFLAPRGGPAARLIPQTAMYLGIVAGRFGERELGLAPYVDTGQILAEGLGTLVHFNGMERILGAARGPQFFSHHPASPEAPVFFTPAIESLGVPASGEFFGSRVESRRAPARAVFMMGEGGEGSSDGGSGRPKAPESSSESAARSLRRRATPLAIPQGVHQERQSRSLQTQRLKRFCWRLLSGEGVASRALPQLFSPEAESMAQARTRLLDGPHTHRYGFGKLIELGLAVEIPGTRNGPRVAPTESGLEAFRLLRIARGYQLGELPTRLLSRLDRIMGSLSLNETQRIYESFSPEEVKRAFDILIEAGLVVKFQGHPQLVYLITFNGRDRAEQWRHVQQQARTFLGTDLIREVLPPDLEIRHLSPDQSSRPPVPTVLLRRGIPVRPEQMIVSVGRGSMLTTRGTTLATRSAAMRGIDHPQTLAHLAEDFRLVRYRGPDSEGQDTWVRSDTGELIGAEEIAAEFGERLLKESGIRPIPLEGEAQNLPVGHGALIPEALRTAERVLAWMAMSSADLKGTSLENQMRNFRYASDAGIYGLWAALGAHVGFGFPLHETRGLHSSRFGASQGSAAPGIERWMEIYEAALRGRDSLTYHLQSALLENGRGLYLNTILPHFDFSELRTNPQALERILPPQLEEGAMPNTGGVNTAFSQACASGLYALWGAHRALVRTGIPGEYPMDAMMVLGADATFSPYGTAPMVVGFSRRAPATITGMMERLRTQDRLPPEIARAYDGATASDRAALWRRLPESLRRQAMNESSAPFTRWAQGLVVGEAAAALPWENFDRSIRMGRWPSARLLGIGVNSGEGGAANLAGMDQGVVTALRVALNMAGAHGARPRLVQAHGTSTALNNIAELKSLYSAMHYQGYSHPIILNALKGLVGHPMGAASAVDMVMGVQTLLEGRAPGLFNFRTEDLDPRYAERIPEALAQFRFPSEPVTDFGDSLVVLSEGFLSSDAAAVLGAFPQELEPAVEMLRDYGFDAETIAAWKDRAPAHREAAAALERDLRTGDLTLADIALHYGFNNTTP